MFGNLFSSFARSALKPFRPAAFELLTIAEADLAYNLQIADRLMRLNELQANDERVRFEDDKDLVLVRASSVCAASRLKSILKVHVHKTEAVLLPQAERSHKRVGITFRQFQTTTVPTISTATSTETTGPFASHQRCMARGRKPHPAVLAHKQQNAKAKQAAKQAAQIALAFAGLTPPEHYQFENWQAVERSRLRSESQETVDSGYASLVGRLTEDSNGLAGRKSGSSCV